MRLTGPRLSALHPLEAAGGDGKATNDACHGNLGGVQPNEKAIIAHARVVLAFWGTYYDAHPDAMDYCEKLCRDLIEGRFVNGLTQYGVGRGQVVGAARTTTPAAPATLSEAEASAFVRNYVAGLPGEDAPAIDEASLLYVIFLPPETTPTISSGNDDFCGYHFWAKLHPESVEQDVFYAIIRTDKAVQASGQTFAKSLSQCVSHEIAEALTSRDGRGYHNGTCEIGDLCEDKDQPTYGDWTVEMYWSGWEGNCIDGAAPVNVRTFLNAIGHHNGLAALHVPTFDLEYIASRMR